LAKLLVVVGSTNPAKIKAAERVFGQALGDVSVRGVKIAVPPHISEMPVGPQVKEGALFRAEAASATCCHFSVGMEGGVDFEGEGAYLYNWVAVRRFDGVIQVATSSRLLLPPAIAKAIKEGASLGELMIRETGEADINEKDGAIGYYTRGVVTRQAFFEECLACALAPFLRPAAYGIPDAPFHKFTDALGG